MYKRSVQYDGMDCLKDMTSSEYASASTESQMKVPWTAQSDYAKYTIYFGVVVIFIAFMKHIWFKYKDYNYVKTMGEKDSGLFSSLIYVVTSYFRYLAYKQVPAKLCYITSLPPSVGSSLFMVTSSFYLFCYCLIPHFWYRGCKGFGSPPLAVRAGVMATALTPFIYILAGKSNMISLVTGISYEKLNSIHQFVGVATLILSVIHAIPFIYQPLHEGGAANLKAVYDGDFYYLSGIPPFVLLAWLCIASKKCIRKVCYEGFLHLHWACGIAFFGTLIWHIDKSLNMQNYLWGALAFWATQVIYRILIKTTFKPNTMFLRSRKGELKKLSENSYEVSISNIKGIRWSPGQHCYLRFIGTRILDNHPFSISSIHSDELLRFIIVPQKGLTKALYEELDQYIVKSKKVYIDGPYGGPSRDIHSFDKVILMSSGSGVTVTLPFLLDLSNSIFDKLQSNIPIITKKLDFIWIIRHSDDILWIADDLKRCIDLAGDYISIRIYVSCPPIAESTYEKLFDNKVGASEVDAEKTFESSKNNLNYMSQVEIHNFKPNVLNIMNGFYPSLQRKNLIISSGSQSMKVAVSCAASSFQKSIFNNDMNNGVVEEVHLHTESFGW